MGSRFAEITDLLTQRKFRMETQMRDMCAQIQTMNATLQNTKPTAERSESTSDNLFRDTEAAPTSYATKPQNPRNVYPKPR